MVIGFEGENIICENNDISYYGRNLATALAENYPNNYYIIYTPRKDSNKKLMSLLNNDNVRVKFPRNYVLSKHRWYTGTGLMNATKKHGVNIYHCMSGYVPSVFKGSHIPTVITFLDPMCENVSWLKQKYYRWKSEKACDIAKIIITLNQEARAEVINRYGVSPEKVRVVHPCYERDCDESVPENMFDILRSKYSLPKHFILYKGRLEEEDNIDDLVRMMSRIDKHTHLLLLGYRTEHYERVSRELSHELYVHHCIRQLDKVHHTDLTAIVHMAQAVVMPTTHRLKDQYKLINAQRCGAPIICADTPVAREYGADAVIYVKTPEEAANHLNRILDDEQELMQLKQASYANSENFTSEVLATAMIDIYQEVLHRHRSRY